MDIKLNLFNIITDGDTINNWIMGDFNFPNKNVENKYLPIGARYTGMQYQTSRTNQKQMLILGLVE